MVKKKDSAYWLTPVKSDAEGSAEEVIRSLVEQEHMFALSKRMAQGRGLKPNDWICFYAAKTGVIAHARVASSPRNEPHPKVRHSEEYPCVFRLDDVHSYSDAPIVVDIGLRSKLDAFAGRSAERNWSWLVQFTTKLTKHDFKILTGQ
jgi:hypothetical protein